MIRPHPTTQIFELMMRTLARPLFRWLNVVRFGSRPERQQEAKFPAAEAHQLEWTSRSSRAAGRASFDALRPSNHQKFIKNIHEILYVRKVAPPARSFPPPKRRWPGASVRRQSCATEEGILVQNRGFFCSSRKERTTQWFPLAPPGAKPA